MLGLLLIALTAAVGAEDNYAGERGHLTLDVNGRKLTFIIDARYDCENDHGPTFLFSNRKNDKLINVQALKPDKTTVVPIAEWRPGDTILASIEISNFNCAKPDGKACGTMNKTIKTTLEFSANDFCHRTRNSSDALTFNMEHIRRDDVNDKITFRFYCYLYSLYELEQHDNVTATCETEGYKEACWRCPCCGKCFSNKDGTDEITDNVIPKLGHKFDDDGVCMNAGCPYRAEAYIYNPNTKSKSYRATAAEAIADAGTGETVIVVSYAADKTDPIVINKIVNLTVINGVTVPEIRLEALSGQNTGAYTNINNYGNVKLLSSATAAQQLYPPIFIFNHGSIDEITVSNAIAQDLTISNTTTGTITKINIPQTDITSQQVQISNSGTITTLTGYPENVELRSGTGSYGTITSTGGTADQLLDTNCYFYFPNDGQKWVNSNAGSTVSTVIVSYAPFTVTINRDNTALTPSNGSYTVDGVNVNDDVALSAAFRLNTSGLKVSESEITSRWYYKGESKNAADGKALTLDKIQYGVYDLIFEAKESTYGFTASVSVTVNVTPSDANQ